MATLDPQVALLLEKINMFPRVHQLSVAEAREQMEATAHLAKAPEVARITDLAVPGPAGDIPIRLYAAQAAAGAPVLVYFHGGGHVIGSINSHHVLCCDLARRSGAVVVSVEYRLAPEHPFPAPLEDAYAATRWVAGHAAEIGGDPTRVGVAGDSAGGNLAAAVTLLARERGGPHLCLQALFFPGVDHATHRREGERSASAIENASGYLLEYEDMTWFSERYVPDAADVDNPLVSPLRANDLSGLPPALVCIAGFDPLRDEGGAYARRLGEAGVDVKLQHDADLIHGWSYFSLLVDRCGAALEEAAAWIRVTFATAPRPAEARS